MVGARKSPLPPTTSIPWLPLQIELLQIFFFFKSELLKENSVYRGRNKTSSIFPWRILIILQQLFSNLSENQIPRPFAGAGSVTKQRFSLSNPHKELGQSQCPWGGLPPFFASLAPGTHRPAQPPPQREVYLCAEPRASCLQPFPTTGRSKSPSLPPLAPVLFICKVEK